MKAQCSIGTRVFLTAHHWLRPYESGTIVDQQKHTVKKWLVQFVDSYPGGGIGGDKIWCDEGDFANVLPPERSSNVRRAQEAREFSLSDGALLSVVGENGERRAY